MKCKKCAGELPGGKVICPRCNFNNALQNPAQWKARTEGAPLATEKSATAANPPSPLAAKVRARYGAEANLLHFPVTPKTAEETAASESPSEPAWRAQTKAKVREHLERRKAEAAGGGTAPAES